MTVSSDQLNQARTILDGVKDVLIVLPKDIDKDKTAVALSLYLALSAKGKGVTVVCPSQMTVEYNHLVGVDKIGSRINGEGGKNLVISFPYQEGSIEKVSYNIENNSFNLVIEPREGYPQVTPEMIRYSSSGGNIDLIITVGVSQFADLDYIYNENQSLFSEKQIINIDNQNQNQRFGKINIVEPNFSSLCELVVSFISNFGLTLDPDIATNLLEGITFGSQNFTSPQTSAFTFEAAAICLKNGARKMISSDFPQSSFSPPMPNKPQSIPRYQPASPFRQTQSPKGFPIRPKQTQPPSTFIQQRQTKFQPQPVTQPYKTQLPQVEQPQKQQTSETPPDWLKPKIYKGSTLL